MPAVVTLIMNTMFILSLKVNCNHLDSTAQNFVYWNKEYCFNCNTFHLQKTTMVANYKDGITPLSNKYINFKVKIGFTSSVQEIYSGISEHYNFSNL